MIGCLNAELISAEWLNMNRALIAIGVFLIVLGFSWPWIEKIGFGRLPGDIAVEKEGFRLYVPIATSIVISVVLSGLLFVWNRFGGPKS